MNFSLGKKREQLLKLEALRLDVAQGVASVKAGKISHANPDDIIKQAKARKPSR